MLSYVINVSIIYGADLHDGTYTLACNIATVLRCEEGNDARDIFRLSEPLQSSHALVLEIKC